MLASNDALVLLKADHDKVKYLLRAFADLDRDNSDDVDIDERKAELIDDICYELTTHALVEEEIFYPALRAAGGNDDLLDEAEGEHDGMRELVNQLSIMYPGDEHFAATVVVLGEELGRHVEKEERELFAAARHAGIDLAALGLRMAMRRSALDVDMTAPPAPANATRGAHAHGGPGGQDGQDGQGSQVGQSGQDGQDRQDRHAAQDGQGGQLEQAQPQQMHEGVRRPPRAPN